MPFSRFHFASGQSHSLLALCAQPRSYGGIIKDKSICWVLWPKSHSSLSWKSNTVSHQTLLSHCEWETESRPQSMAKYVEKQTVINQQQNQTRNLRSSLHAPWWPSFTNLNPASKSQAETMKFHCFPGLLRRLNPLPDKDYCVQLFQSALLQCCVVIICLKLSRRFDQNYKHHHRNNCSTTASGFRITIAAYIFICSCCLLKRCSFSLWKQPVTSNWAQRCAISIQANNKNKEKFQWRLSVSWPVRRKAQFRPLHTKT